MNVVVNSNHPIYDLYKGIVRRCYDEKFEAYKNYGGRGIKVCDIWLEDKYKFYDWALSNGWQDGLEIDRINVNGDYEPSNCRFVTRKINNRNRRDTRYITYNGQTCCVSEWSEKLKIPYSTLYFKLFIYKEPLENIFSSLTPVEDRFSWGMSDVNNTFEYKEFKPSQNSNIIPLADITIEIEYNYIMFICEKYKFNYSKAAEVLGIDRKTIYNKISKFEKGV